MHAHAKQALAEDTNNHTNDTIIIVIILIILFVLISIRLFMITILILSNTDTDTTAEGLVEEAELDKRLKNILRARHSGISRISILRIVHHFPRMMVVLLSVV